MATLQKYSVKNGKEKRWRAIVRITGYPDLSKSFLLKSQAKTWAEKVEYQMRAGIFKRDSGKTVADAIDRWIKEVSPIGRDEDRKQRARWWKTRVGHYRLNQLSPAEIAQYRDEKAKETSGTTANAYLSALSAVYGVAVRRWHWCEGNPLQRVERFKGIIRERVLSDDECMRLLQACESAPRAADEVYLAVLLSLNTAARRREIMSLRWEWIDWELGTIHLPESITKTSKKRSLVFAGKAKHVLLKRFENSQSEWVFPSPTGEGPVHDMRTAFERALREANIDGVCWHDLRRTAATWFAEEGESDSNLQLYTGHRDRKMLDRYSYPSETIIIPKVHRMIERRLG